MQKYSWKNIYNPDWAQKLISSSMSRHLSTRNIWSKSLYAFLSNLAHRQTDKWTRAKTYTSSFVGGVCQSASQNRVRCVSEWDVCQSASQNRVGCVSVSITKQSAMCVSQHHKTECDVCQSGMCVSQHHKTECDVCQSGMCVSQHHKTECDVCQSASQNRVGCVSVGRLCQTMAAAWLNACLAVSLAVVAVAWVVCCRNSVVKLD